MTTALVEGVEDGAPAGGAAEDEAIRPEHGLGDDVAITVEFADGLAAAVKGVGAAVGAAFECRLVAFKVSYLVSSPPSSLSDFFLPRTRGVLREGPILRSSLSMS